MRFRMATLNLEQDHKRWGTRRDLVVEQLGAIRPDMWALNEVCIPLQTARWLQKSAKERLVAGSDGQVTHPTRPRMDRCIDFIWVSGAVRVGGGGVCFNQASAADASLWPSDHAGVWADLEVG